MQLVAVVVPPEQVEVKARVLGEFLPIADLQRAAVAS